MISLRLLSRMTLLTSLVACAPARAQQGGGAAVMPVPLPPQITTSAQGEATVTPNRATIELSVQTRAASASAAGAENARRQRAVMDTLRKLGLRDDQLSTINYNVYPETRYDERTRESQLIGYNVTNTIRADVRRIDQVGPLIDAALGAGANMISSLSFYAAETDAARRSALTQAVTKARADAEAIARAAGGSLGELLEVSSADVGMPRPVFAMGVARDAAAAPTPVNPGQQTLIVGIVARWRFITGAK